MKTREEIQQEYIEGCRSVWAVYGAKLDAISAIEAAELDALNEKRKAALAELDDPVARLIAAGKGWRESHSTHFITNTNCKACDDFQSAIDYAEQRRAQG